MKYFSEQSWTRRYVHKVILEVWCGTSNIRITWDLVRQASSLVPPQVYTIRNWVWCLAICLKQPYKWFCYTLRFEKQASSTSSHPRHLNDPTFWAFQFNTHTLALYTPHSGEDLKHDKGLPVHMEHTTVIHWHQWFNGEKREMMDLRTHISSWGHDWSWSTSVGMVSTLITAACNSKLDVSQYSRT